MTLTIEKLPDEVDRVLRERAAAENKSLDAAAVDALCGGLGIEQSKPMKKRDLSFTTNGPPLEPEVLCAFGGTTSKLSLNSGSKDLGATSR